MKKTNPVAPYTLLTALESHGGWTMSDIEVFHFEEDSKNFESYGQQNGFRYWLASDLAACLGYTTMAPVFNAVNKAMAACAQIEISISENFQETKSPDGARDWKMSRFACYLAVMNGDPKNPKVAKAQAYFITMAEAFRQYIQQADGVERILIRGEISDREKALTSTAYTHGVEHYPFFQNAGYRGMYNMDMRQIRQKRNVPANRSPLDFMGKSELAANLFRITQTDEKIRNENIRGQYPLERAAEIVGKGVRKTMMDLGGTPPEQLSPSQDIKQVKSAIKRSGKEYAKLDKKAR